MKHLLLSLLAAVAVVGCSRGDVYPTTYEACLACHERLVQKKKRSCEGDSTNRYTNVDPTATILRFEGGSEVRQLVRRFKWRNS